MSDASDHAFDFVDQLLHKFAVPGLTKLTIRIGKKKNNQKEDRRLARIIQHTNPNLQILILFGIDRELPELFRAIGTHLKNLKQLRITGPRSRHYYFTYHRPSCGDKFILSTALILRNLTDTLESFEISHVPFRDDRPSPNLVSAKPLHQITRYLAPIVKSLRIMPHIRTTFINMNIYSQANPHEDRWKNTTFESVDLINARRMARARDIFPELDPVEVRLLPFHRWLTAMILFRYDENMVYGLLRFGAENLTKAIPNDD